MKNLLLFTLIANLALIFSSCDDAGIVTLQNTVMFNPINLKPLNSNMDGIYEAWICFDAGGNHADTSYVSIGRFYINSSGNVSDSNGNPISLALRWKPNNVIDITEAIVTIESPGDYDTIANGTRLMGGTTVITNDFVYFQMSMSNVNVLGNIAAQFPTDSAKYILFTPTCDTCSWTKGVWFTQDTLGTTNGFTMQSLPSSSGWVYRAYLVDIRDTANRVYYMGRFTDPAGGDDWHSCEGQSSPFNKPGHDWITTNCIPGIPDVGNINDGNYKVLVALEPSTRIYQQPLLTPFFIRLFYGFNGVAGPGDVKDLPRIMNLPTGYLQISRK